MTLEIPPQRVDAHCGVRLDDRTALGAEMSGTDLPVPLCGTCGSIPVDRSPSFGDLLEVLAYARTALPAPPFDDRTVLKAERWVEDMRVALDHRRFVMSVVHDARELLREERVTRRMIDRQITAIQSDEVVETRRSLGEYWTHRESGRVSQRSVRVDTDPVAWERFKAEADVRPLSVGTALGELVTDFVEHPDRRRIASHATSGTNRRIVQLRIVATDGLWASFKAASTERGFGVSRCLGMGSVRNFV